MGVEGWRYSTLFIAILDCCELTNVIPVSKFPFIRFESIAYDFGLLNQQIAYVSLLNYFATNIPIITISIDLVVFV
jgi:hypothetical protein